MSIARRDHLVALLVALVVVACTGDPPASIGSQQPNATVDPALLGPLTALGPCQDPPAPMPDAPPVEGLRLPPTSVITAFTDTGPLTQVRGYAERTPVEIRVFYADRSAGLEVITIEDEVREAEVLATDGSTRMFLKAQAVCERGSFFVAFVAPAGQAELLPEPALGGN